METNLKIKRKTSIKTSIKTTWKFCQIKIELHGKKFGTDAASSGRTVAFTGRELCDYIFMIYMKVPIEIFFSVYIYR